jgi:hypothetical protein
LQGDYWLDIAKCGMSSGDASLVSVALAFYDRYFSLYTFKFDDHPFLRLVGRSSVARYQEHVGGC